MAKVYIGVGHGGKDPGAVSGVHKEKTYALDIANACTAELERHGVNAFQSRIIDEDETAAEKIIECNKYDPDLCIDIHLNAGGGDGFEIYHSVNGGKGKTLAQNIEKEVRAIGQNSRGLKTKRRSDGKDYFGIVRQTNAPATLVECAFIDNKTDVQIIDELTERIKMGKAIAKGILTTLGITYILDTPKAEEQPETDEKALYRVQVGAYSVKANAEKMKEKLKAAGFNAIIVKSEV